LQKIVHVFGDASDDPRFRSEADAWNTGPVKDLSERPGMETRTVGQAKSVLCVPILQQSKGKDQVSVVLEAVDKLEAPQFDMTTDVRILRLLGKVSMEILKVCNENSSAASTAKRKDALLQLITASQYCKEPVHLLQTLDSTLRELFHSQASSVHTVHVGGRQGGYTTRFKLEKGHDVDGSEHMSKDTYKCFRGIAGSVAKSNHEQSVKASQLARAIAIYDEHVDLHVPDNCALHTVPIHVGAKVLAVVQFLCPESRDGVDGPYQSENTSHFKVLSMLLTFVQHRLSLFDCVPEDDAKARPSK
jgi:hypothetical protein